MKKFITYTMVAACGLIAWGCEDFLNEQPQSDFTRPQTEGGVLVSAYETVQDAQNELNGAYASFKTDLYELSNFLIGDVMSDNCYVGGDGINEEQFDLMTVTPTNSVIDLSWSQYYTLAGSATSVIENIRLMPEDSDPAVAEEKARITAEAKFIRAWAYFDIVRLWGDAPMTLELIPSITAENLDKWYPVMYPARTPADEIYTQILKDLDDAVIADLPRSSTGLFQATQGAAHGLRAKVYATMGDKASRDYNKVVTECEAVEAEGYELVQDFDVLWTIEGKHSTESIFELEFSGEAEQHNWAYWVLLSDVNGEVEVTWRRYCTPTRQLVEKFQENGTDVRYASSIIWAEVPYSTYYPASNYPLSYKIRREEQNIILLRLADILLLKAEALVELGRVDEAVDIVDEIRERAQIDPLPDGMSQDQARLAVEDERQLELYMEGQRWFDLVRNDRMEAVMSAAKDKDGNPMVADVQPFRRLMPVPQGQIDINERLTQNPEY